VAGTRYGAPQMSVSDSPPDRAPGSTVGLPHSLEAVLVDAGAVLAPHHGATVALSYGSAAGELAGCLNGVGIAARSELTKLELSAPAAQLEWVLEGLLDRPLLPRGILLTPTVGWFRVDDRRLLALCDPAHGARLRGRLEFWTMRDPSLTLRDRSNDWSAIAVLGRHVDDVLAALGVYGRSGDCRAVAPITRIEDDPETTWLLCGDRYALALTPSASAAALWRRIAAAGRRWGMCAVGHEALARYRALARTAARA
jgi:glycine cleavage system aminomethyltransferase T